MTNEAVTTCGELAARLLSSPAEFDDGWLGREGRRQAPVPAGPGTYRNLAERMAAGARTAGAGTVLVASLDPVAARLPARREAADVDRLGSVVETDEATLLCVADLSGAVLLVPGDRYALVAGDAGFLAGALPEGVDTARARFSGYARRIGSGRPAVAGVAARFGDFQRVWRTAGDVPADSHVGHQLGLMRTFSTRKVSAEDFARGWLDERRRSLDVHERIGDGLARAMENVFYALEDFAIDPSLRDEDDLTPEQLRAAVDDVLAELSPR